MIYFSLWVVFLLTVLLAVPVAAFLEKRKYRVANPKPAQASEEPSEGDADLEPMDDDAKMDEVAEFSEVNGGDDFSSFDDIK